MKRRHTPIYLGLFVALLAACDDGGEYEAELALDAELELGIQPGVESPHLEALLDEPLDILPQPQEGTCGPGYWDMKVEFAGCCEDDSFYGEGTRKNVFLRWCWEGPPSCGGCTGWDLNVQKCTPGCGVGDEQELELAEPGLETAIAESELEELADPQQWSEDPSVDLVDQLDVLGPLAEGICDKSHWDIIWAGSNMQECGSCDIEFYGVTRPGAEGIGKRRWCWDGPGCGGCGPWEVTGSFCYDVC